MLVAEDDGWTKAEGIAVASRARCRCGPACAANATPGKVCVRQTQSTHLASFSRRSSTAAAVSAAFMLLCGAADAAESEVTVVVAGLTP